jgi:hypothetical protein
VYIQFILKYLTLLHRPSIPYPHHPYQLPPAFVYGRSRRTRSYTANSSSLISLLFFPPSVSLLSQPLPGPIQHSNMAERVWRRVVLNPVGWTCGQVRNHSGPGYKYCRFLSTAAVCSSRYGCALETAVIDRKQSNLGGCPGFPHRRCR